MRYMSADEMVRAYKFLIQRLKNAGIKPKKHVLDNEISEEFKNTISENDMEYELIHKGQHRRNIA